MYNQFAGGSKSQDEKKTQKVRPMFTLLLELEKKVNQSNIVDEEDRADMLPAWSHLTTGIIRYERGDDTRINNLNEIQEDLNTVKKFFSGKNERADISQAIESLSTEINHQITLLANKINNKR